MKSRILLTLMLAAVMTVPATAQFAAQVVNAGDACNYAPTLGIDSAGNLYGCGVGNGRTWISAANGTLTFTNKTFDTAGTGNSFLINGLAVTANTGTGAVVRATAPTFPTTITLGVTTTAVGQMVLNNLTSGTITVQPVAGALGSAVISVPAATDTLVGKATTDTLSGKSFNQNVVPLSAGATDLGTTALPWGNMWLGAAATNNFKFAPASLSAARTLTVPDPGGDATLAYTNSTTPQVMSGLQNFTGNKAQVLTDFTDANSASLQAITGLSITFPTGFAGNINVHCVLSYTQATASAGDQFGIGVTTTAPTRADAFAIVATNATAVQQGFLNNLTSTTPTATVTFTPAVTTQLVAFLDATLQLPSSGAKVFQVYVLNGTAANVIVVKAGSTCSAY